jgi:hypothetical protein
LLFEQGALAWRMMRMLIRTNNGMGYQRKWFLRSSVDERWTRRGGGNKAGTYATTMAVVTCENVVVVWMAGSSVQMFNAEFEPLGGSRTC